MTIETTTSTSELALPTVTGGDLPGLAVLQQWADANDNATRLVAQWIFTDLVPLHHWPNPAGMTLRTWPNPRLSPNGESDEDYRRRCQIATASASGTVLRGIALGLSPNIALEQMHSIHGKIGMMTRLKYALAIKHKVKVWDVELSEESVTCAGIHPLTGETVEITITMEQARKAEWLENKAYTKTPIDMLWARAMSRVLDRVAGHVLFGLASVEDIDPEPDEPGQGAVTTVTAQDIKARVARPAPAAVEARQPQLDHSVAEDAAARVEQQEPAPAAPDGPVAETGEAVTLEQRKTLGGLLRKLDLGTAADAEAALTVISAIVRRPVPETADLARSEAEVVLAKLEELTARTKPKWQAEIRELVRAYTDALQQPADTEQIAATEGDDRG